MIYFVFIIPLYAGAYAICLIKVLTYLLTFVNELVRRGAVQTTTTVQYTHREVGTTRFPQFQPSVPLPVSNLD